MSAILNISYVQNEQENCPIANPAAISRLFNAYNAYQSIAVEARLKAQFLCMKSNVMRKYLYTPSR